MCTRSLRSWNGLMHTMRPPSRSKPQPPSVVPTKSSHYSSRAKMVHSITPILPSCNYCGNLAHKISECNILSEDLFCDYCGKEGHHEIVYFAKFSERKQLRLPWQNLPTSSKSQSTLGFHLSFPHQG